MTTDIRIVSTQMLRLLERNSHQLDQGPPPFKRHVLSAQATNALDPKGLHIIQAFYITPAKHLRAFCAVSVLPTANLPGNTEYVLIDISARRYMSLRSYEDALKGLAADARALLEARCSALQARFRPPAKEQLPITPTG